MNFCVIYFTGVLSHTPISTTSSTWLLVQSSKCSLLMAYTYQGRIQGGGGLWGCNPPKAPCNQRRIKESSSAAQALGAHAPYARASAKKAVARLRAIRIFLRARARKTRMARETSASAAALHISLARLRARDVRNWNWYGDHLIRTIVWAAGMLAVPIRFQ